MTDSPPSLSGRHIRHLRALAHDLDPVVQVGREALSEGLLTATDRALLDHELIKVRLPQLGKTERKEMAERLAKGTRSTLVQSIGRVVVLYRRHPDEPRIPFPRGR